MSIIAHNISAMDTQRQLNINTRNRVKVTEKLASGYRVNRAADDAASLSISEKMRSQIRNLSQATNNVQDGISYVQTADGALEEITNILHRMEELSVKAANDTNSIEDRVAIQDEIDQLRVEMDQVFISTEFNGKKIWNPEEGATPEQYIITGYDDRQALTFAGTSSTRIALDDINKGAIAYDSYKIQVQGTDASDAANYGFKINWTGWNGKNYSSNLISWDEVGIGRETSYQTRLKDHLSSKLQQLGIDFPIAWTMEDNAALEDIVNAVGGISFFSSVSTSEVLTSSSSVSDVRITSYSTNYLAELASGRDMDDYDSDWLQPVYNTNGGSASVLPSYTSVTEDTGWEFKMNLANVGNVTVKATSIYYSSSDRDADDENGWWYKYKNIFGNTSILGKSY